MRPGRSHLRGVIRKSAGLRRAISIFFIALGFCGLCGAQEANPQGRVGTLTPPSIDQVRDAVLLASGSSELSVDAKLLKVTHRDDLEDLLSSLVHARRTQGLYLYQVDVSTQASFDGPISGLERSRPCGGRCAGGGRGGGCLSRRDISLGHKEVSL